MTSGGYLADQPGRVANVTLSKARFESMSDNTLTRERSIRGENGSWLAAEP